MYSLTMCWEGDLRMQVTQGVLLSPSRSTLRHRREIVRVNSKTLPLALNHSLGRRLIVTQWLLAQSPQFGSPADRYESYVLAVSVSIKIKPSALTLFSS